MNPHPMATRLWLIPAVAALGLAACDDRREQPSVERGENSSQTVPATQTPPPAPPRETPRPQPERQPAPPPPPRAEAPPAPPPQARCDDCGHIAAITPLREKGEGSGLGAIAGAVAGGVLGSQVGSGSGRKLATVIGAAGGAYGGHQAERNIRAEDIHEVRVRMDDGSSRTVHVADASRLTVGQPVRVLGNDIQLR